LYRNVAPSYRDIAVVRDGDGTAVTAWRPVARSAGCPDGVSVGLLSEMRRWRLSRGCRWSGVFRCVPAFLCPASEA